MKGAGELVTLDPIGEGFKGKEALGEDSLRVWCGKAKVHRPHGPKQWFADTP